MKDSVGNARLWLLQAENDLAAARLMLREGFYAQACFMAQQVGEKALKGVAYLRGDRFVAGHSLVDLVSRLETTYPRLSDLRKAAKVLDQYYIPTRYPNALPGSVPFEVYDRDQTDDALEYAGGVVALAKGLIEQL